MDSIKDCGFHADYDIFKLVVCLENINDHAFQKLCTFLEIGSLLHFDEELLMEVQCRNDMDTGCNVNPNKKRCEVIDRFFHGLSLPFIEGIKNVTMACPRLLCRSKPCVISIIRQKYPAGGQIPECSICVISPGIALGLQAFPAIA